MADKKISALTSATTPLAGTEVLPIVQSGSTVKVAVSDLTAGRAVATGALTASDSATVGAASSLLFDSTWKGVYTNAAGSFGSFSTNTILTHNAVYNGGWKYLLTGGASAWHGAGNGTILGRIAASGTAGDPVPWTTVADIRITGATFSGGIYGTTVGATSPAAGSFTTLTTSSTVTINGGTANGIAYLDASKVLTTGTLLKYTTGLISSDCSSTTTNSIVALGDNLGNLTLTLFKVGTASTYTQGGLSAAAGDSGVVMYSGSTHFGTVYSGATNLWSGNGKMLVLDNSGNAIFYSSASEKMRLDSSGNLLVGITSGSDPESLGSPYLNVKGAVYAFKSSDTTKYVAMGAAGTAGYLIAQTGLDSLRIYAGGSERARIDSSGNLTVSTGNVVIGTAGKGIDFSATSSGSGTMTSELLADYEEGTWTPNVGGTATYNNQTGTYTKVGRVVTVIFDMGISTIGTGSTGRISGLPFTGSVDSGYGATGYFGNLAISVVHITFYYATGTADLTTDTMTAAGGLTTQGAAIFNNNARIQGSVTYFV